MGGGIILLGIMAVIIPEGYKVIALHGMVQLFSNTIRTYVFRKYVKPQLIKQFLNGALIGVLFSIGIIIALIYYFEVQSANEIKVEVLKPFIGLFIVWNLFLKGPKKVKIVKSFVPVGLVAGLSSIFVGAVGPLIAPFFLIKSFNKEHIIANKAAAQMITHLSKIPLFIYFFNIDYKAEIKILIPLILAVYIGTNFGKQILYFIPELLFKKLFKISLFIIAVHLIINN
ncbi:MAG: hypothetical protein CMG24_03265 [Candidatus Marinimicrobia bacterium]|nr:hypothetical protein [Candidatus Neomarinimicrobiota bacterium]